jgi:DNA polymerase-3 subunit delta
MQALTFLRQPAKPGVLPVYVLHGDDAFLRQQAQEAIVKVALGDQADEMSISRFSGDQASLADVLDEVRTLPFFAKLRVAIVESADAFVSAHRRELEAYIDHPSQTGILVLLVKTWVSSTKLAKRVEQAGLAVECKTPSQRELPGWLVSLARSQGALLDDDAAALLLELVGPEAGLLASEIGKLIVFVGERAKIRRGDVAKTVGAGRIETIWRVLESATTGSSAEALDHLDRLLTSGEQPVGLLAAMSANLRKVHHAGELRKARKNLSQACQEAGIPPFAVELTQRQHAHLGPTRVARLPELLIRADLDLKGSTQLPPRVVLERLLVDLSRPRRD